MNGQMWWFLARSSGIVAWVLLTASVLWGIVLSTDLFPRFRRPAWLLDLHRWLGGLTLGFLALHLVTLWADSYIEFTIADFLIPFNATWKPTAVALGILATWLLIIVQATSLARKRLNTRVWRVVHLASYGAFVLGGVHGSMAGTDAMKPMYQYSNLVGLSAIVGLVLHRAVKGRRGSRPEKAKPEPAVVH